MQIAVEKLTPILAPFAPVAVYVFGSRASGQARPDSDIDIAFVPSAPCDPYAVFLAAQELAAAFDCDVDLIDLSRASAVMKAEVLRGGQRLFVGDARRADEFEMYALSDYARANEERRDVLAQYGG
jgi:predicted nucleotidyltransferase